MCRISNTACLVCCKGYKCYEEKGSHEQVKANLMSVIIHSLHFIVCREFQIECGCDKWANTQAEKLQARFNQEVKKGTMTTIQTSKM